MIGGKKTKVSNMKPDELLAEAKAGCSGLRQTQVLPAIGKLAMKGNLAAIQHLHSSGKQSTHHK